MGIRNQIWVIPTVGCVNGICEQIVSRFKAEHAHDGVDAIVCFPHNYGCSQLGNDHENTRTVLKDMVHHPNAGGVLVVSLGCENNQLDAFKELVGPVDESRVKMFVCQKVQDEVAYGVERLKEIYEVASKDVREDVPVSELRVGLKCGGSDGLSGITANPLLGGTRIPPRAKRPAAFLRWKRSPWAARKSAVRASCGASSNTASPCRSRASTS